MAGDLFEESILELVTPLEPPARPRPPGSPFKDPLPSPTEVYAVGDRVSHDKWGLGRVIDRADDGALLVTFGGTGTQRLVTPYPKLHKL